MSGIEIHPAGAAAADLLACLHATSFAESWSAAAVAELLAMPGGFALVASTDEPGRVGAAEPLGFVLCRALAGECEVLTIAVRPEARGRGVGGALLKSALARAREAGAGMIFLEVAEDNRAARDLYARFGFEIVGRRKHYYRERDGAARDALQLRFRLLTL